MKKEIILILSVLAVVKCGDLIAGHKLDGQKIFDEKIEATPTLWKQQNNLTINATEGNIISRIVVTDLRETKDAEVDLVEGKIGDKSVTLQFKSPAAFRGYEFHVEVYSSPDDNNSNNEKDSLSHPILVGGNPMDNQFDQPKTNLDNLPKTEENASTTQATSTSTTTEQPNRKERNAEKDSSSTTEKANDDKKEIKPTSWTKRSTSEDQEFKSMNGKSLSPTEFHDESSTTEQQKRDERNADDINKGSSTVPTKINEQHDNPEVKPTLWTNRNTREVKEDSLNTQENLSTTPLTLDVSKNVPTNEKENKNEKWLGSSDTISTGVKSNDGNNKEDIAPTWMQWQKRDTLASQEDTLEGKEKSISTTKATNMAPTTEEKFRKERNAMQNDFDSSSTTQQNDTNENEQDSATSWGIRNTGNSQINSDNSSNDTPKIYEQNDPSKPTNGKVLPPTENQNREERQTNVNNDENKSTTIKTTLTTEEDKNQVNESSFWMKRKTRSVENNNNKSQVNFKSNDNKTNLDATNKNTESTKVEYTTEKVNHPINFGGDLKPENMEETIKNEDNNEPTTSLNKHRSFRQVQTSENSNNAPRTSGSNPLTGEREYATGLIVPKNRNTNEQKTSF